MLDIFTLVLIENVEIEKTFNKVIQKIDSFLYSLVSNYKPKLIINLFTQI